MEASYQGAPMEASYQGAPMESSGLGTEKMNDGKRDRSHGKFVVQYAHGIV